MMDWNHNVPNRVRFIRLKLICLFKRIAKSAQSRMWNSALKNASCSYWKRFHGSLPFYSQQNYLCYFENKMERFISTWFLIFSFFTWRIAPCVWIQFVSEIYGSYLCQPLTLYCAISILNKTSYCLITRQNT